MLKLDVGLEIEATQDSINIQNKFGSYQVSMEQLDANTLVFNRVFSLNKGRFEKEDYEAFRKFWLEIVRFDKSKIALKIKS